MAASTVIPIVTHHARSISLPSRSHPLTISVEENLFRLRASEATSSCSSSSICHNLGALSDLYEHLEVLLQLPHTQQVLSHEQHGKWVDKVLDGSLGLLDVCGISKDVLSLMKENVQEVESSLRRRRGGESGYVNEVQKFVISRKKVNKMVLRCIGNLKKLENNCNSAVLDKDHDHVAMVNVLRETVAVSLSVFESLLSYVSGTKERSKQNGWSLVSKFMLPKRVASEEEEVAINVVAKIQVSLDALKRQKSSKNIEVLQVQNVLKQLEAFELSIQELEEGLECLFRHLIKTRVSLLNIVNH